MIIFFGWGHRTAKSFGPVKKVECSNCNNESDWHLQKVTTWFTLFFIPVIPYEVLYLLVCPVCRYCVQLEKAEFEEYKSMLDNPDSNNMFSKSKGANGLGMESNSSEVRRTETQINFIKQMKELELEREKKNSLNNT